MTRPVRLLCAGPVLFALLAFLPAAQANETPYDHPLAPSLPPATQTEGEALWELRWGKPERHWYLGTDWQAQRHQTTRIEGGYQLGRARLALDFTHQQHEQSGERMALSLIARYRF
ncbi:hypothetical protein [Ferrimonas balearica]|uniref:hypothetical protein n=1 Tax=Ferrimonas balearica TaxID=44012 RepID=UPI001C98F40A|nr:hypothetical protein [Ferrimonas balearica]MBY5993481.1 hypothetical protein [Ferrimonas balearica]